MDLVPYLEERAYLFYPKNISVYAVEHELSKEFKALSETLIAAKKDSRWWQFKSRINQEQQVTVSDLSYYSLANTCFTLSSMTTLAGFKYHVKIYIGILANICSWKAECIYEPDEEMRLTNPSVAEAQLLIKKFEKNELDFMQTNKIAADLQEPSFKKLIIAVSDIQAEIFGYDILPDNIASIIVPSIETNRKSFGEVTIFDCLLSDLKF